MELHGPLERCHVPDRIRALALDAFGNALDAEAFLSTPHSVLGGRPPLEVAMTAHGAHCVEELLAGPSVPRAA